MKLPSYIQAGQNRDDSIIIHQLKEEVCVSLLGDVTGCYDKRESGKEHILHLIEAERIREHTLARVEDKISTGGCLVEMISTIETNIKLVIMFRDDIPYFLDSGVRLILQQIQ